MKKILIVILILLFAFALIRITASTYENITRNNVSNINFDIEQAIIS